MEDNLKERLKNHGQEHLLSTIMRIEEEEHKKSYTDKLSKIDLALISKLFDNFKIQSKNEKVENYENINVIKSTFCTGDLTLEEEKIIRQKGYDSIAQGKIALLILAGGQGSRLGYEKAKGSYNVGMPSNKCLFQYLVERFISAQHLSVLNSKENQTKSSTLFIMTSLENHNETQDFFSTNDYFGLKSSDIIFFPQDTIPAITLEGKIINKNAEEIFENPNGNGGCFIAMKNHNIINEFEKRSIEYFHVISVDNPLTKVLDPLFVGLNYKMNAEISAKFAPKRDAHEPIGVFVNLNGKAAMIDYGNFPKMLAEEKDLKGGLKYKTGNILNYLINVPFLSKFMKNESKYNELIYQFNYARKKIDNYNPESNKLEKIDGIKFELFFNSIFAFAESDMVLLEVDRNEEFAPIKNPDPSPNDTPKSCRRLMTNLFKKWLNKAEINQAEEEDKNLLEISFLKSYDGENLNEFSSKQINLPSYLI